MNVNLTIIGQIITFIIFLLFFLKYVWPPIYKNLNERTQKISEGIKSADLANKEFYNVKKTINKILNKTIKESNKIIINANLKSNLIITEGREIAFIENKRILKNAKILIYNEIVHVKQVLRNHISEIIIMCTDQILQSASDYKSHSKIINKFLLFF
ncbi:ATP synthase subunit b [Candidatus Johnevansia muelleri]|uniref:ATP synthase subunit b n=1 Tax=Candidatus Johnevansia muelleri TaxID=1495769 RepID=A0A078KIB9_9GAMM|nr:ATP synthase subunit b [Candidatus Evansia muelleri]